MSYKQALLALAPEAMAKMDYADLCALRGAAYQEHLHSMTAPAPLKEWAAIMQTRLGNRVKVWHMIHSSWLVALLVVRYGEAIESWPAEFSPDDVARAAKWERGGTPAGVSYVPSQGGVQLACAALAVLALALAWLSGDWWWTVGGLPLFGTAMTDFLENKLADHLFRTTTYSQPATLAIALFTAAPGETGGGTEVSGGSYARVANNPANGNWNATQGGTSGASSGTGGLVDNAGAITFPTPTANWGSVTHFAILDATSGGNMLIYGALAQAKTVNNGDPAPSFAAGALDITFA